MSCLARFVIYGRLDGLNEYTKMNRANRYGANALKHKNEQKVIESLLDAKVSRIHKYPCKLKITWYEPNSRRDIDNIVFATKFIQDALVKHGILENDSQKYIGSIEHKVLVDKTNPRIEVEVIYE